jgi:hypothetical protein
MAYGRVRAYFSACGGRLPILGCELESSRFSDGLSAVGDAELSEYRSDVMIDGPLGEDESAGYLLVAQAGGQ